MKNIIKMLGGENFPRIRMGVGEKPKNYDLADWVLGHFNKEERAAVDEAVIKAVRAVEMMLTGEIDGAMNEFNRKVQIDSDK